MSVPAKDKQATEWKTGILIDSEIRDEDALYQVDDGEKYVYVLRRSMRNVRDKPILVTVNGPVKFALDGDEHVLLLDEKGKEHRLSIIKKSLRK